MPFILLLFFSFSFFFTRSARFFFAKNTHINSYLKRQHTVEAQTTQLTYEDILLLFKETSEQMKRTDEQMKRTDQRMEKTDKKINKMSESIGRLGNRLGEFVEEMVRPAAVRLFKERDIEVHEVHQNIISQRNGEGIEID